MAVGRSGGRQRAAATAAAAASAGAGAGAAAVAVAATMVVMAAVVAAAAAAVAWQRGSGGTNRVDRRKLLGSSTAGNCLAPRPPETAWLFDRRKLLGCGPPETAKSSTAGCQLTAGGRCSMFSLERKSFD